MGIDQVYTPDWLADAIAGVLPDDFRGIVFDPTAGTGALLLAAERRFGDAVTLVAADIDRATILWLRAHRPTWTVGVADVYSVRSRAQSVAWSRATNASAVLLNPPFSFRGGAGRRLRINGEEHVVGPAAAAVGTALAAVPDLAIAVAVLPYGAMLNRRDEPFWAAVGLTREIRVLRILPRKSFPGVAAESVVVSLAPRDVKPSSVTPVALPESPQRRRPLNVCSCVELVRGRVPVHSLIQDSVGVPFVHTTSLSPARTGPTVLASPKLATPGPAVLVPRVGKPDVRKIDVRDGAFVLSDCLYAVRPKEPSMVGELASSLRENFSTLASGYGGTGAPHLRTDQLAEVLTLTGWHVTTVRASAEASVCVLHSQGDVAGAA